MFSESVERPESGARLLVKLAPIGLEGAGASDARGAAYVLVAATRERVWEGRASVGANDGEVVQRWNVEGMPPWLEQAMHALLRSAWQRQRSDGVWPRRLSRWRPAPGEATE